MNNIISLDMYSDTTIEKGFKDELAKGGEGSRGGKIIGHTKSGKAIYDHFDHPGHKDFTSTLEEDSDVFEISKKLNQKSGQKIKVNMGTEKNPNIVDAVLNYSSIGGKRRDKIEVHVKFDKKTANDLHFNPNTIVSYERIIKE